MLFSPYTIRDVTFKNRIVMSPMCMYACDREDGTVHNWHLVHYATRAVGQVGLIIVEATAVTPQGRISARDLGIWDDNHIDGLRTLTTLVHEQGANIGIQLAHAGRKATVSGEIIAPSPIPFDETMRTPKEMTKADIEETIDVFQQGARRAKEAGFDVIEIHAAHGYLINEFLSPLTNKRTDEYGGENRYRFLSEIIEAVKEVWNGPLFVRISAHDYHPDGLTVKDYVEYAKQMKAQGVDLIDVSSGAVVPAKLMRIQVIKCRLRKRFAVKQTCQLVRSDSLRLAYKRKKFYAMAVPISFLSVASFFATPYWPKTAANELGISLEAPKPYVRGW